MVSRISVGGAGLQMVISGRDWEGLPAATTMVADFLCGMEWCGFKSRCPLFYPVKFILSFGSSHLRHNMGNQISVICIGLPIGMAITSLEHVQELIIAFLTQ